MLVGAAPAVLRELDLEALTEDLEALLDADLVLVMLVVSEVMLVCVELGIMVLVSEDMARRFMPEAATLAATRDAGEARSTAMVAEARASAAKAKRMVKIFPNGVSASC